MPIRAAELQVVIGADVNAAVQGIRGAMGQIQQAGMTALGVFTGNLLYGAVQQAGQALIGLGQDALQSTVSWERLRFSIESLMASELRAKDSTLSVADALNLAKGQAADTLKWIQDLAIISPFPTEVVAQVFQMQMRMGQTSDQAKTLTKALLDMGAATGLSGENLYGAGLALSQIGGSAKLSAQDLHQLINAGIPVNEILQEMGITWDQLGKKAVSGQAFIDAFIKKAGEFSGSVDRMQGSWSAMLGALSDAKDVGLRELFAGVFTALQPVVQQFSDWLLGPGMEKLRQLGADLGMLAVRLIAIGKALFTSGAFSQQFNVALGRLSPTLREIWEKISPFIQQGLAWISEHKQEVIAALTGMAIAFGALTIIGAISGLITALANPITLIIALAGLLAVAWQKDWGGIQRKTAAVWAWLKQTFIQVTSWIRINIPTVLKTLKKTWDTIWEGIQSVVSTVLSAIASVMRAWQTAMKGDWRAFGTHLQRTWDAVWGSIQAVVSAVLSVMMSIMRAWQAAMKGDWRTFGVYLLQAWDAAWEGIHTVVSAMLSAIMSIVQGWQATLQGGWYAFGAYLQQVWNNAWNSLAQIVSNAWATVKNAVENLITNIITFFMETNWIELGESIINGIINGILSNIEALIDAILDAVQAMWDAVTDFLGIESPSKLFRDEIAGNIMEGWAQGIRAHIPRLETTMIYTAKHMTFAAQPAQPTRATGTEMSAITFYAPVTFRVENEQTMRNILKELRK